MFLLKAKNFYLTLRNFDIILSLKLRNSRIPRNLLEKLVAKTALFKRYTQKKN